MFRAPPCTNCRHYSKNKIFVHFGGVSTGTVHDWPIYFIARFIKSASLSVFIEKLDGLGPVDNRPYPDSVFIIINERMTYSMN